MTIQHQLIECAVNAEAERIWNKSWPNQVTISAWFWRDWGKPQETLLRTSSGQTEIWKEYPFNKSLQCHHHTTFFCYYTSYGLATHIYSNITLSFISQIKQRALHTHANMWVSQWLWLEIRICLAWILAHILTSVLLHTMIHSSLKKATTASIHINSNSSFINLCTIKHHITKNKIIKYGNHGCQMTLQVMQNRFPMWFQF